MSHSVKRVSMYAALLVMLAFTLLPFLLMLITSLRSMNELMTSGPISWPNEWHWSNFVSAWKRGNFAVYYKNTIIFAAASVTLISLFSLLTAYVFSFLLFPGKKLLMLVVLIGLMIPHELLIIPLFSLLKSMSLLNTYWALILPTAAFYIPFGTFLLSGFISSLPYGVIESARMDGAGEVNILMKVIAPMLQPAIVTVAMFATISSWNSFLLPTIMIQKDELRTVSVGLNYFRSALFTDYPMMMAGALIIAFPVIVVYLILHRRMIEGLTAGSVKG